MSKFLGPIHHWLHSKIILQEKIELEIENEFIDFGINLGLNDKWNTNFNYPNSEERLEEVIDENNIHGWLQNRIQRVETRFAGKLTELKSVYNEKPIEIAMKVYQNNANHIAAELIHTWDNSLNTAHKLLHNYILEGMPCDQAGAITVNNDDILQWKSDKCLHNSYWENVNGDVLDYYKIRDSFNKEFFKKLGNIEYERTYEAGVNYYQIKK